MIRLDFHHLAADDRADPGRPRGISVDAARVCPPCKLDRNVPGASWASEGRRSDGGSRVRHHATILIVPALALIGLGWTCGGGPSDSPADAGETATEEAVAEPATDVEPAAEGKALNPAHEGGLPESNVEWGEHPLDLGFPTEGWEVYFGQGMCMPRPACQELKAVKEGTERMLENRAQVEDLVSIIGDRDQALAYVRFFTDHQYVLVDERCAEVDVAEDGTIDFRLPKGAPDDEPITSAPVKVVEFEGGFRVERTLACRGDEKDRLVRVSESVFTAGNWSREEIEVLVEQEGLIPRLK